MRITETHGNRYLYDDNELLYLSFGKIREAAELHPDDRRIETLGSFVTLIYQERYDRMPQDDETIRLRHADDLAVAAMFGIEYPGVTQKTFNLVESLGLVPDKQM